ncbi:UDP-glycosyltransferase 86a1 [Phtheirospermum japonicum]|uniref:Glycosyltransferase n=1 Tax=Phtheirospermum japonicum TaxID=374723 RepID=A0A830CYD9_9LAMI|nr:UDP-glycosyltransferase 86a1 [Phtheirospermum japonicum]
MLSKTHHKDGDIFSEARKSGLDVRYATISDGFPLEFDRVVYLLEYWDSMMKDLPARIDEFVGNIIRSDPDLVHFLVVDTLYSWASTIAQKHNLVNVSVWTEPAVVFSLAYHSELLRENGHFPCKGSHMNNDIEEEISYIPGIESINTKDFMPYLKESEVATISYKLVLSAFKEANKTDFILHNTVQELESEYLPTNTVSSSLLSESDCSQWLDSKSPGSVLYISFGSLVQTNKQVIEEIANGLLLSEVEFVWAIRAGLLGPTETNVLPTGFEDVIKDKGLIIPWCDQTKVLSNPAVGGFLSHCGWNSILESIWCGVPMICYPVTYDQPTNRKLVVDDWMVGINLCDGKSVDRNEVAEKIKRLMNRTTSQKLRQNVVNVSANLHNAVEIDGSSEINFDRFIEDLKGRVYGESTSEF